jgi:predicted dehydrogenase
MPSHSKLRFGIVGCGSIGPTHAAALRQLAQDVELLAVADVIEDRARDMARTYEVPRVYSSDRELIADRDIDCVIFCTPSGMHAHGAVAALQAGKHVVVEKPMDISLEACDRMIQAEDRSGRKLAVISQHRWDRATRIVKQAIDNGTLGKILLADMNVKWWRTQKYYDSGDWRGTWKLDGGGALMNQGIHTVDLLQWLAGDVKSVFAHMRTAGHERIEVEDLLVATVSFRNGAIGTMTASTAVYDGLPVRIDIAGTEGTAIIEGDRLKLMKLKNGQNLQSESAAVHALSVARGGTASVKSEAATRLANTTAGDSGAVWGDAHREQLRDFIDAIHNDRKPLIDGRAARKPVEIILAVYQSARTGKPVELA